jgi:hypothetical protein
MVSMSKAVITNYRGETAAERTVQMTALPIAPAMTAAEFNRAYEAIVPEPLRGMTWDELYAVEPRKALLVERLHEAYAIFGGEA